MKNKLIFERNKNFADWYTSVIKHGKLIEYGPIKGTMFFLPNGWAIWEKIKNMIDFQFKKINVKNVQLPLFIRYSDFIKEKQHISGFAPELFIVNTNNKTENNQNDQLIIRPTSEINFCQLFKSQLKSYNDLPLLYNQWCSVCRAEKNTRPFLRNIEFYWQELHTIHSTENEAIEQAKKALSIYEKFITNILCIPVLVGKKTNNEKFAGANITWTLEALMQDGQMLQCATSHSLGQNFARTYDLKYQTKNNNFDYVWQTSSGLSTRIIGGLIMCHSDDNGLVLPFHIAPIQIGIISLMNDINQDKKIKIFIKKIKNYFKNYRISIDTSDKSLGYKINNFQIQGTPFCLIIGQNEIENNEVTLICRNDNIRTNIKLSNLKNKLKNEIKKYHHNLYNNALNRLKKSIIKISNFDEFKKVIHDKKIALGYFNDTPENEKKIKELTGASARCIKSNNVTGKKCFFTNENATHLIYFGRAY